METLNNCYFERSDKSIVSVYQRFLTLFGMTHRDSSVISEDTRYILLC